MVEVALTICVCLVEERCLREQQEPLRVSNDVVNGFFERWQFGYKLLIFFEQTVTQRWSHRCAWQILLGVGWEEVERPGVSLSTPFGLLLLQPAEQSGQTTLEGERRCTAHPLFIPTISCRTLAGCHKHLLPIIFFFIRLLSHRCLF